ncbi:MAG: DUF5680 domain-containing protein [bacterium]
MSNFSTNDLSKFIKKAASSTYAGGEEYEKVPERPGFFELVFTEGDWSYRDSYTGFYRSSGMEVVRFQDNIVWTTNYGGGMVEGKNELARETFNFLKAAMLNKPSDWDSFRGPNTFREGSFEYKYSQTGDISLFHGEEEIFYQDKLIFFHRIIGGIVVGK